MKRRYNYLHQYTHQFDPQPFEAYWSGSWAPVERIRIRHGVVSTFISNEGEKLEESIPMSDIRIRSRKATLADCLCFLRPGTDVCVHSSIPLTEEESSNENPKPIWIDARISSVERKPHENDKCICEFHISIYMKQNPAGMIKKSVHKDTKIVHIDQISILQKLEIKPCDSNHYRWRFSEDCNSRLVYKLFTGKFSSDLSWLIVASVFKQLTFDVKSVDNQIVYQIFDDDSDNNSSQTAVNFKLQIDTSIPFVSSITESREETKPVNDVDESQFDLTDLRRSKRRKIQPERYLGDEDISESEIDLTRFRLYTPNSSNSKYEEIPVAFSIQDDHSFKDEKKSEFIKKVYKQEAYYNHSSSKSKEVRTEVPYNQPSSQSHSSKPSVYYESNNSNKPDDAEEEEGDSNVSDVWSRYFSMRSSSKVHNNKYKAPQMDYDSLGGGLWKGKVVSKPGRVKRGSSGKESVFDTKSSFKKSICASVYREMMNRCMMDIDASINIQQPAVIDQWKQFQMSESLQQKESKEMHKKEEEKEDEDDEEEEEEEMTEEKELEMLWKEMELALATTYLMEETEGSHEVRQEPKCLHDYRLNEQFGIICRLCGHVRSEIKDISPSFLPGVSWTPNKETRTEEDDSDKINITQDRDADADADVDTDTETRLAIPCRPASSNMALSVSNQNENVWALIPNLRDKLRFHQKRAFEFLWRNLAGDIIPSEMESAKKKRGGCVISHTPGAGKTLLIISFLVSYLKLFPNSRPLVLAPKTTLYTWYKEIIKWEIPIPVYQIHGGQTYREEVLRNKLKLSTTAPGNQDVMHVLDCLEKIQKWLTTPSVLLMGYTSFLTLTREDSSYAHRQYMAKVLRQCPGILILDEGHNPRSTKSRLRKGLMKVHTPLRVLLSGTLFQNNFGEYFNTLTLSRPRFVTEVLKKLDPKFKSRKKGFVSKFTLENRARKLFAIKIAEQINSSIQTERQHGLDILKSLTSKFIDNYEGGTAENLPGLQCYTLMMKSSNLQQDILHKLQQKRQGYRGFPLELELLITLGSIHPWLIQTTSCASQYFEPHELKSLQSLKSDLKLGTKIRFVMSLVPRCLLRKEKVLIFCHNIAPMTLLTETFEKLYGWRRGVEVLILKGDLELFERGRVIDKFEEPSGPSQVMLASINACAEGISLTAASRVILLDSEWNPSKSKQAIARAFRPGQDKVVYVYQLLATGTLEEEKHSRTTWKEWVSSMIFSEELVEDPSHWSAPKIEDELLREIVEEDRASLFHAIMKNEKASNMVVRGRE